MPIGTLYGISAGPGDPELLTVRALRLLQQVSIVAFPAGVHGKPGVAEQIIQPWLKPTQTCLPLNFPYVQDEAELLNAWSVAAREIWQPLSQGRDLVFVSEGDASFYSTFTYLAQMLRYLYPQAIVETIPGVCSPLAAAAAVGLPLTLRDQRLMVLPALYHLQELEAALAGADVVVLMKVSSLYQQVWKLLSAHQLLEQSYVVEWATHPQQRIYPNLQDYPDLKLHYFSLLIVQVNPVAVVPDESLISLIRQTDEQSDPGFAIASDVK